MSKKLRNGLRFNAEIREELASTIAKSLTQEADSKVEVDRVKIANDLFDYYWESVKMPRGEAEKLKHSAQLFPTTKGLTIVVGDVQHVIALSTPQLMPYDIYRDQKKYFLLACKNSDLKERVKNFATAQTQLVMEQDGIRQKMLNFFNDFTSPKKLAEAAPELAQYFPEDYYDEAEEPQVTLQDLLAA